MLTKLTPKQEERMEKLREKDYSSLIGKEIIWHYPDNPEVTEIGIIANIDPDLGFTIVNKKDHNDYLSCGYGILGIEVGIKRPIKDPDKVIAKMERVIEALEKGDYTPPQTLEQILFRKDPSQDKCIFNQ